MSKDEEIKELVCALSDMVSQNCTDANGQIDSWALSAHAEAIRLLEKHGKVKITAERGRRVIAEWIKEEK